jgi:hypothetical protein
MASNLKERFFGPENCLSGFSADLKPAQNRPGLACLVINIKCPTGGTFLKWPQTLRKIFFGPDEKFRASPYIVFR